jgi:hypothetical protein
MATPVWYTHGLVNLSSGSVDLVNDSINLMLVASAYTPAQTTDSYRSDLGANEASGGSGYSAGGFTLGSKTVTTSGSVVSWDAADISQAITGGPLAFQYGVFYKARGGAASVDELVGYVDFSAQSITDATLNITLTNQLTITAASPV